MKKLFLFLLALTLVVCLFTGCDQQEQIAALKGPWYTLRSADADTVQSMLLQIDLNEQELALIEPPELQFCQSVEFGTNKAYMFRFETAVSQPFFRAFYREVFQRLYEGRAALSKLYRQNFEEMSQDAFFAFYAQLYMEEDFQTMLDHFALEAGVNDEILEYGTFFLRNDDIFCTDMESNEKAIRYQLDESGALLLTYANATELYTHQIPTP